ncbi:hypothetical protein HDV05_008716 [Chytridiales sp. JEL 0842]|nr:hypothetical protein HDV05_008716 [Chytridiales sp. JEL 0842]
MVDVSNLKKGMVVQHKGKFWVVHDYSLHTQGRQGSHYKVDIRDVLKNVKVTERFNAGSTLEVVELDDRKVQFLYADDKIHLLDRESMEEIEFDIDYIPGGSKAISMLTDETDIRVLFLESTPVVVKLPQTGKFKVTYTDPPPSSVSNEGKGTLFKNAILDNGVTLTVPEFVVEGDTIIVDIADQKYVSRAPKEDRKKY